MINSSMNSVRDRNTVASEGKEIWREIQNEKRDGEKYRKRREGERRINFV